MNPWQSLLKLVAGWMGMETGPNTRVEVVFELFPGGGVGMLISTGLLFLFVCGYLSLRNLGTSAPKWSRIVTGTLRGLALVLPALVILGPSLVVAKEKKLPGKTIILADTSWSMQRHDPGAQLSRWDRIDQFLNDEKIDFLGELAQRNQIKVFGFDTAARTLAIPETGWPKIIPTGQATNLQAGLRQVLTAEKGGRIAGAVLFTDGRWNEGGNPDETLRLLKSRHIPLHVIGVGDPTPRPVIKIIQLTAPERAFSRDPFDLTATLQIPPAASAAQVVLKDRVLGQTEKILETKQVNPGPEGNAEVCFHIKPETAGVHCYTLQASALGNNGTATTIGRVVVEIATLPARVLMVAGSPTWEYRCLRKLFTRDNTVNLSCWLQSADRNYPQQGNTPIKELPRELVDLRPFHLVILVDPDPEKLDLIFAKNLEKSVRDEGMGLTYIAGEKYTYKFFTKAIRAQVTGPLADLLPASPDQFDAKHLIGISKLMKRAWPLALTPEGMRDRILALDGRPDRTNQRFKSLPGMYWNYPFKATSPGAHILAVHPGPDPLHHTENGPRPLLAWHHAGAGKVYLAAVDETWRWRGVATKTWDRYWVRLARFLAEGKLLGDRSVHRLVTSRRSYEIGSEILLIDKLPRENQIRDLTVEIRREGEKSGTLHLAPAPDRAAELEGRFTPTVPGLYEICIPKLKGAQPARFEVTPPGLETPGPMDEGALKDIAQKAEGSYQRLVGADTIPSKIPAVTEILVAESRPRPLWDNALFLALTVALLAAEWALRKWMNLP